MIKINRANAEHNFLTAQPGSSREDHQAGATQDERDHVLEAWLLAGASATKFEDWWTTYAPTVYFDSFKALAAAAWDAACRTARGGISSKDDEAFRAWWDGATASLPAS